MCPAWAEAVNVLAVRYVKQGTEAAGFRAGSILYTLVNIYLIISGFLFVVCSSRTIFGNRKGAHVHLEGWKHGNGDTGLNMACTQ